MLAGFLRPQRGEYLADWLDWLWSHDDEIIFTATGGLLRVAQIEPPDLETADREQLVAFHAQLCEALTLPGTGWSGWFDQWRREDRGYLPESDFGGNLAAEKVDASRRVQFVESRTVFTNRAYVALHWTPQERDAVLAFLHDRVPHGAAEILRTFRDQSDEFFRALAHICPAVRVLTGDALATYLAETVTYRRTPTRLPRQFLATQLAVADWDTGAELIIDGLHVVPIDVHVFGAITPLTLEPLHELPFECRWTVTSHFLDPEDQRRELAQLRNFWRPKQYGLAGWLAVIITRNRASSASRPDVDQVMSEIDDLEGNLQAERDGLAISSMTVRVWDTDPSTAEDRAQTVVGILNASGMRARPATFSAATGALADIPGNASRDLCNRRRPRIRLSTIGRCTPLTGLSSGTREDEHLSGPALLVAQSRRRGPLFWALHAPGSDVGHTAVIGPTGGGKSALLSFMALQYLRYPGSTVTIFDKRQSAMVTTLCSDDSKWIELGTGGVGIQPLRDIDDAAGMSWATSWLQQALELRQVRPCAAVDAAINEALLALRGLPPHDRTISALCAHMGGDESARRALEHYTAAGPLGELVDGVVPDYGAARILCIEYDPIMGLTEGPLVFAACFRQIERERLTSGGHPKLVMIDEAWEPLRHPLFRDWLENLALTGRKLNMQMVLATQSIRHLEQAHTAVIMEQTPQRIFTTAPQALQGENARVYAGIGLTSEQIHAVAMLRPKGEYLLSTPLFCRVCDISLEGDALRICGAGRDGDIRRARALLARGVQPGREFLERWLA